MASNNEFKLLIFDSLSLILKKVIINAPKTCSNFFLVSPKYNEYFKMKIILFEKTYTQIYKNLNEDYDFFKVNKLGKESAKAYKTVKLISKTVK